MRHSALRSLSLALLTAGLFTACGSDAPSTPGTAASQPLAVASTLGKITGAEVRVFDLSGNLLGSGNTGTDGRINLSGMTITGPFYVEVRGTAGARYFDETCTVTVSENCWKDFPAGARLRAVSDSPRAEIGVSVLTEIAVRRLEAQGFNLNTLASNSNARNLIFQENYRAGQLVGIDNPLLPPALVDGVTELEASDGAEYALKIAALARLAGNGHALENFQALIDDLADGRVDDATRAANLANLNAEIQAAAQRYGSSTYRQLVAQQTFSAPVLNIAGLSNVPTQSDAVTQAKALVQTLRAARFAVQGEAIGLESVNTAAINANVHELTNLSREAITDSAILALGVQLLKNQQDSSLPASSGQFDTTSGYASYDASSHTVTLASQGNTYQCALSSITASPTAVCSTSTLLPASLGEIHRATKRVIITPSGANQYAWQASAGVQITQGSGDNVTVLEASTGNSLDGGDNAKTGTVTAAFMVDANNLRQLASATFTGTMPGAWGGADSVSFTQVGIVPATDEGYTVSGQVRGFGSRDYMLGEDSIVLSQADAGVEKANLSFTSGSQINLLASGSAQRLANIGVIGSSNGTAITGQLQVGGMISVLNGSNSYPSYVEFEGSLAHSSRTLSGKVRLAYNGLVAPNPQQPLFRLPSEQLTIAATYTREGGNSVALKLVANTLVYGSTDNWHTFNSNGSMELTVNAMKLLVTVNPQQGTVVITSNNGLRFDVVVDPATGDLVAGNVGEGTGSLLRANGALVGAVNQNGLISYVNGAVESLF